MAFYLNPILTKVLERLAYERLLFTHTIVPRKRRIRLQELLQAAKEEPRILELLPILLLDRPGVLYRLSEDLKAHPEVKRALENVCKAKEDNMFLGIPVRDCIKTLENYRRVHTFQRGQHYSRNLTIRLSEDDLTKLRVICKRQGIRNQSQLIRQWIDRASHS